MFTVPREILLYDDAPGAGIDLEEIAEYLKGHLPGISVRGAGGFFSAASVPVDEVAGEFARARVRNTFGLQTKQEPLPGEVEYERRRLLGSSGRIFGIPYDGFKIQRLASSILASAAAAQRTTHNSQLETESSAHIIFTNQLLGSWDADDRRFHLRAAIYGFPSLVSTSGIVEAPAKPRGYYLLRDRLRAMGQSDLGTVAAQKEFEGSFLVHGDKRLTEVAKGYAMQAVFFHMTGDPFCDDPDCRLFNAHWQEELLRSQLSGPEFCERHSRALKVISEAHNSERAD